MKYKILFIVSSVICNLASAQTSTFRITGNKTRVYNQDGTPNELQVENATKTRTGAFLKNAGNGLTEFAYAVDSLRINDAQDTIFYYKNGWKHVALPQLKLTPTQFEFRDSILFIKDSVLANNATIFPGLYLFNPNDTTLAVDSAAMATYFARRSELPDTSHLRTDINKLKDTATDHNARLLAFNTALALKLAIADSSRNGGPGYLTASSFTKILGDTLIGRQIFIPTTGAIPFVSFNVPTQSGIFQFGTQQGTNNTFLNGTANWTNQGTGDLTQSQFAAGFGEASLTSFLTGNGSKVMLRRIDQGQKAGAYIMSDSLYIRGGSPYDFSIKYVPKTVDTVLHKPVGINKVTGAIVPFDNWPSPPTPSTPGINTVLTADSVSTKGISVASILLKNIYFKDTITATSGSFSMGRSNVGSIKADSTGSISFGYVDSAFIRTRALGALAFGNVRSFSTIEASGIGSFARGAGGNATVPLGFIQAAGTGSTAFGTVFSSGSVRATGFASLANGYAERFTSILSSGTGSIANGYSGGTTATTSGGISATSNGSAAFGSTVGGVLPASLISSGVGSFANGYALSGGIIRATSSSAFAQGIAAKKGLLEATSNAAFAQGYAGDSSSAGVSSSIRATNFGSFAQGYAAFSSGGSQNLGFILSSGRGSFAQGHVVQGGGTISATGDGSLAHGYVTGTAASTGGGLVQSNGLGSTALGYSPSTEDSVYTTGNGSVVIGQRLFNTGNNSVLMGTGLRNITANITKFGYNADYLTVNGSTTTVDVGVPLNSTSTVKATQYNLTALNTAPPTATSTGILGETRDALDGGTYYHYLCIATNTWVRFAYSTW